MNTGDSIAHCRQAPRAMHSLLCMVLLGALPKKSSIILHRMGTRVLLPTISTLLMSAWVRPLSARACRGGWGRQCLLVGKR